MPNAKGSVTVAFEYPFPEERVFRYQAMQDTLSVLVDQPYEEFAIGELAMIVDANQGTISKAVRLLAELGVVTMRREGRKQYVSVNRDRLDKSDPVLAIPQSEFHKPVRAFIDRVREDVEELVGVVLFGSVARGEADRASDIDLLVVVRGEKTSARRAVQSIVQDLEGTTFDGNRYTFQPLVESVDSARRIGERLQEQFDDGLTLVESGELADLRREVYADGE
jgi:predicted nucleotidyltransferase